MSKLKKELENIDKHLKDIEANEKYYKDEGWPINLDTLRTYYQNKRAELADKIGRKTK